MCNIIKTLQNYYDANYISAMKYCLSKEEALIFNWPRSAAESCVPLNISCNDFSFK